MAFNKKPMINNVIKQIYDTCFNCKKKKFWIRRREVPLPNSNLVARSRERICSSCYKDILKEVAKGANKHD